MTGVNAVLWCDVDTSRKGVGHRQAARLMRAVAAHGRFWVRSIHLHHLNQFRWCSTSPFVSGVQLAAPELRRSFHWWWRRVQDEIMALPALPAEVVQKQPKNVLVCFRRICRMVELVLHCSGLVQDREGESDGPPVSRFFSLSYILFSI